MTWDTGVGGRARHVRTQVVPNVCWKHSRTRFLTNVKFGSRVYTDQAVVSVPIYLRTAGEPDRMAGMSEAPHILFWIFRAWILSVVSINLLFMLFSPKAWSRLPWWLTVPNLSRTIPGKVYREPGPTVRERLAIGWGALLTRLVAAAGIVWIVHSLATKGFPS